MKQITQETLFSLYDAQILNFFNDNDIKHNDKLLSKTEIDEIAIKYPHFPVELLSKLDKEGKEFYIMPIMYGNIEKTCSNYKNFQENNDNLKQLGYELLNFCEAHIAKKEKKEVDLYLSNSFTYKKRIRISNKHGNNLNLLQLDLTEMKYSPRNKLNITKYAKILANSIEDKEDLKSISNYYNTLITNNSYSHYNASEWAFRIWSTALKNIIKTTDTFDLLPRFFITRYKKATNEVNRGECVKIFEKFDFHLVKEYLEDLFKRSPNHQYVLIARKLLEKNNALKNESAEILVEQHSRLALYQTTFVISTSSLLKRVNNDNALMPKIIEHYIINYLIDSYRQNIYNMKLNWSKDNEVLSIVLQTQDEKHHEQFKADLEQLLHLVFDDSFLYQKITLNNINDEMINFLKDQKKFKPQMIEYLEKYFKTALLKYKLDSELKKDNLNKKKVNKI